MPSEITHGTEDHMEQEDSSSRSQPCGAREPISRAAAQAEPSAVEALALKIAGWPVHDEPGDPDSTVLGDHVPLDPRQQPADIPEVLRRLAQAIMDNVRLEIRTEVAYALDLARTDTPCQSNGGDLCPVCGLSHCRSKGVGPCQTVADPATEAAKWRAEAMRWRAIATNVGHAATAPHSQSEGGAA